MVNTITAIRMQLFSLCHRHESEISGDAPQNNKSGSSGEVSISQPTSVASQRFVLADDILFQHLHLTFRRATVKVI